MIARVALTAILAILAVGCQTAPHNHYHVHGCAGGHTHTHDYGHHLMTGTERCGDTFHR